MNTFTDKKIDLTITLGTGTFGESIGDTFALSNLRIYADLSASCGESMGALQLRVFGLTQSMMSQLTRIGLIGQAKPRNTVLLSAGDSTAMYTIFEGTIYEAWADYNAAPEVVFNIIAYVGMDLALKPVNATSIQGTADVGDIMKAFASSAGLAFNNFGVNTKLSNPYFPGTLWTQIKQCALAAGINYEIGFGALSIWPQNGNTSTGNIPVISPQTGMVGYPSLSSQGITIRSVFNQNIKQGGLVQIESSIITGTFNVFKLQHSLSSQAPGGPFFTIFDCTPQIS